MTTPIDAIKIIKDELARMPENPATKALSVAVSKLDEIDNALRVPAAEYVPAISDAFMIIDTSYSSIANILSGGKDGN